MLTVVLLCSLYHRIPESYPDAFVTDFYIVRSLAQCDQKGGEVSAPNPVLRQLDTVNPTDAKELTLTCGPENKDCEDISKSTWY